MGHAQYQTGRIGPLDAPFGQSFTDGVNGLLMLITIQVNIAEPAVQLALIGQFGRTLHVGDGFVDFLGLTPGTARQLVIL